MNRVAAVLLVLTSFVFEGCADTEPPSPPIKDALEGIQEMKAAEEAAAKRRLERAMAIRADAQKAVNGPEEGIYKVRFQTTAGDFVIEVDRSLAPIGAHRFYQAIRNGFYDDAAFFRVVPGFVVQFGIAADPEVHRKWKNPIPDDPVKASNERGTITFATSGPDSRTTQVFINFSNNSSLDSQGFAPFGRVVEGMDVVDSINASHGEQPQQPMIEAQGAAYLEENFPNLDYIQSVTFVEDDLADEEAAGGEPESEEAGLPGDDAASDGAASNEAPPSDVKTGNSDDAGDSDQENL